MTDERVFWMCKGLPASGKSSWAENMIENVLGAGKCVRVNMDLIRDMLHHGIFKGRKTEDLTQSARDDLLMLAMQRGVPTVISDDTNLNPKCEERFRELAARYGYKFQVKDFTHVDWRECVKRDLKRSRSVGDKVIREMYMRYLRPPFEEVVYNSDLPFAVIVDIDGTLAHMTDRSPYDWARVGEDAVDIVVRDLVNEAHGRGDVVLVVSGRDGVCEPETKEWLLKHDIPYDEFYIRPAGDQRNDAVVKSEIFDDYIAGRFNIRYVLDDRDRVVEMWRARGMKVLQVEPGDF